MSRVFESHSPKPFSHDTRTGTRLSPLWDGWRPIGRKYCSRPAKKIQGPPHAPSFVDAVPMVSTFPCVARNAPLRFCRPGLFDRCSPALRLRGPVFGPPSPDSRCQKLPVGSCPPQHRALPGTKRLPEDFALIAPLAALGSRLGRNLR